MLLSFLRQPSLYIRQTVSDGNVTPEEGCIIVKYQYSKLEEGCINIKNRSELYLARTHFVLCYLDRTVRMTFLKGVLQDEDFAKCWQPASGSSGISSQNGLRPAFGRRHIPTTYSDV